MAAYTTVKKPKDYFNTKIYSGNSSAGHAITGVGFQPDWVWIKSRSGNSSHTNFDAVRGQGKAIYQNATTIETTVTGHLTSFDSDGFTLGDNSGTGSTNGSSTYVAWNWKAGTTGSGTTGGSGTSKAYTYSVNTTAGFSIIRYLGNQTAGHAIPHHLGDTPKFIIVKNLADTRNWNTYHHKQGGTKYLVINANDAEAASASLWNDSSPTSSNIILGSGQNVNQTDSAHIAYCFAEKRGYSKFGIYTGTGNADGTFVYTGFRPAWGIFKKINGTGDWLTLDDVRDGGYRDQPLYKILNANSTAAEASSYASYQCDFVSTGFKIRNTLGNQNADGDRYIYIAFAELPLVGDNPVTAR